VKRRGDSGNVVFAGAGISNQVISEVKDGNISFTGIGALNIVKRIGGDQGDIVFNGVGAANHIVNTAKYGNTNFTGCLLLQNE
jgi:RTX toxin RtxA